MSKLKRFHLDVFCPEWAIDSIDEFTKALIGKQLICSYHATKKYKSFSREYKHSILNLIEDINLELCKDYIFEFYTNDKKEVKKVCYRFPMRGELESDVILVISSTGRIVTMFLNRNFDPHVSLDISLYEKGDN